MTTTDATAPSGAFAPAEVAVATKKALSSGKPPVQLYEEGKLSRAQFDDLDRAMPYQVGFDLSGQFDLDLAKSCFIEFFATMLFLYFTLTTVIFSEVQDPQAMRLMVAFVFGLSIFVLVYMFAVSSGANINPAVSWGLMLGKRISVQRCIAYIISQCLGAAVGAACAMGMEEGNFDSFKGAANLISPDVSIGAAYFGEMICTCLLMLVVLHATCSSMTIYSPHYKSLLPYAIGMAVTIAHLVLIPATNCGINPARSFGAAVAGGEWKDHWLFWLAPLTGSTVAVVLFESVFRLPEPQLSEAAKKAIDEADQGGRIV